jgi:acyl carrier protein
VKVYKAPATVTEELVAQIWEEVLKLEKISTDENFFDLGGHSLLATQVISRIRRVLGVDLPLRTMFDVPTVARIAEGIDAARLAGESETVPAITRVRRDGPLPLSYAQQRLWILDQMEPNNYMYNIPRSMRMRGQLDVAALTRSLNEIVRRHEPLRTWFGMEAGQPVQHIEPELGLHVREVDLTAFPAEERESKAHAIVAEEATTPFDLSIAPLLRAMLLKLDAEDHVLMLTMHHIVSDAWSATVFMQELTALYESFLKGAKPELPELTLQYADFASWQRAWLEGETLNKQLSFWRSQLAGAPPLLTLPTDRPRPEKQTFAGGLVRFILPADVAEPLRALSRKEGVTLFMALLAGYQVLLSRVSGQEQVVVGTDSANRFTVETERMIGFFINLLPLKADFAGDPTFRDVLAQVRETTLACYARQEMPFDKIVEELRPDRKLSHNPIVQVLFVMQNIPTASRQLGGVEISGFNVPLTRSKFDIAVFVIERGESVECLWVYSTELFDESTVNNMAGTLATLLADAVANPDKRVGALELYSGEQQKKLKEEKQQRKRSSKEKLMSAGLKAVDLGNGTEA